VLSTPTYTHSHLSQFLARAPRFRPPLPQHHITMRSNLIPDYRPRLPPAVFLGGSQRCPRVSLDSSNLNATHPRPFWYPWRHDTKVCRRPEGGPSRLVVVCITLPGPFETSSRNTGHLAQPQACEICPFLHPTSAQLRPSPRRRPCRLTPARLTIARGLAA